MPLCQVLPHRETTCISCKRQADLKNKTEDKKAYTKIQDGKTKRNDRNETYETTETTKTKRQ